jgi:hypothetical protein
LVQSSLSDGYDYSCFTSSESIVSSRVVTPAGTESLPTQSGIGVKELARYVPPCFQIGLDRQSISKPEREIQEYWIPRGITWIVVRSPPSSIEGSRWPSLPQLINQGTIGHVNSGVTGGDILMGGPRQERRVRGLILPPSAVAQDKISTSSISSQEQRNCGPGNLSADQTEEKNSSVSYLTLDVSLASSETSNQSYKRPDCLEQGGITSPAG